MKGVVTHMIQLVNISKKYSNTHKETLKGVNLNIEKGEFVCLLGSSGVGKSTLLNMVAGLDRATSGKILMNGKEIKGPGKDRVVMFQDSALFPWLTVSENVQFGDKIAGVPIKEREEKAMKYLAMVNLSEYKDYKIDQLSGGMRQRVALARALAMDSEVLLMDEPFSALDTETKKMLWDEVAGIRKATGKTVLMVTHSVEEAVYLADRIIELSPQTGGIEAEYKIEIPEERKAHQEEMVDIIAQITRQMEEGKQKAC